MESVPRLRLHGRCGDGVGSGRRTAGLAWAGDTGELDRLLRECDVAVVSAPLNEHTDGMIGAPQLRALGPHGVLINVGRGPLVQERALYDALAGGVIRAAAIDVWYRYPAGDDVSAPGDLPFADLPNLADDPALLRRHPRHLHRPCRRHRRQHREVARAANRCAMSCTAAEHVRLS